MAPAGRRTASAAASHAPSGVCRLHPGDHPTAPAHDLATCSAAPPAEPLALGASCVITSSCVAMSHGPAHRDQGALHEDRDLAGEPRLIRCFCARDESARNAGGTPGCGTADGAARRTRGTQTGSPPVPAWPLCQHRACGAPAQREASAALAMPVRTRTAGTRVRTVRTGSLAPRPAPCHAAAVRAAGCPMRSCIHGKTAVCPAGTARYPGAARIVDFRGGNQNLRSAILRSRRWRGGTVLRPGGCRRCGGWPPPAWWW